MTKVKHRSRKEIILIEKTLKHIQHMKFLNNLPWTMRTRFIECCWLEEYESQRVLVNQNRKPEFFYVIVHGSLICTYRSIIWPIQLNKLLLAFRKNPLTYI